MDSKWILEFLILRDSSHLCCHPDKKIEFYNRNTEYLLKWYPTEITFWFSPNLPPYGLKNILEKRRLYLKHKPRDPWNFQYCFVHLFFESLEVLVVSLFLLLKKTSEYSLSAETLLRQTLPPFSLGSGRFDKSKRCYCRKNS